MRTLFDPLSDHFLDGPMGHALRYLPPHERRELRALAWEEHRDDRDHEPTVMLSVRIPLSLAVRLDIERGHIKRALRRRRVTRSDTVRYLLERHLAEQDRAFDRAVPAVEQQEAEEAAA